jgi:hypothetical protein
VTGGNQRFPKKMHPTVTHHSYFIVVLSACARTCQKLEIVGMFKIQVVLNDLKKGGKEYVSKRTLIACPTNFWKQNVPPARASGPTHTDTNCFGCVTKSNKNQRVSKSHAEALPNPSLHTNLLNCLPRVEVSICNNTTHGSLW